MPIRIKSSIDGFRRAGMAHSMDWKEYPDSQFTDVQLAQLEAEPRLFVERTQTASVAPDSEPDKAEVSNDVTPGVGENLLQPLLAVIEGLDPENPELWNADGSPKATNFPKGTSAADRANAWEFFKASKAEQ